MPQQPPGDGAVTNPTRTVGRVAAPIRAQVIAVLRAAILDFRLKPGQRLVERELTESLGVSRTTVREALRELDAEGLVHVAPQRGAFVASPTPEETADLYEGRVAIESVLVRMFVERATPAHRQLLEAAYAGFVAASESGADHVEVLRRRDEISKALYAGAQSEPLAQVAEALRARVQVVRVKAMSVSHQEAVGELRGALEAIRDGAAERAVALLTVNLRRAKETALRSLAEVAAD